MQFENINMDSENKVYDFCIIGGGYGGLIAGLNALRNNLSVAIVERRPLIGGTCLREGCIPSKLLLNSSFKFYEAKNLFHKFGIKCSNVEFDFDMLMKKKDNLLNTMGNNNTNKLKSLGADIFHGWGKIKSHNEVEVSLTDINNYEKKIIKY
jgi:dihydrolipoamide dehydrogenase